MANDEGPAPGVRGLGQAELPAVCAWVAGSAVLVELDLFVADIFRDRLRVGHGFRAEADALDGDGVLVHDDAVLVECDLVLFFGEGGAIECVADVCVGDGFTFDANFFVGDGHVHGLLLGDDVLAQTCAASFRGLSTDAKLLLGTGDGVVRVVTVSATGRDALVAVEALLLFGGELAVDVDAGSVLDGGLVVAHGQDAIVGVERGVRDGDEGLGGAEKAGVDGDEVRFALVVADVDLLDGADLVAVAVDNLCVEKLGVVLALTMSCSFCS